MIKISEKREKIRATNVEVFRRLSTKETWEEVLKDEILGPRCVTNYQNVSRLFLDFKVFKFQKSLARHLPTPIMAFLSPFLNAFYINQTYILSFSFIALLSYFLSFLAGVEVCILLEVCISHVFKGFNEDFLTFFTSEFDFATWDWDLSFPKPEPLVLDIEEPLSTASGINSNRRLYLVITLVTVTVAVAVTTVILCCGGGDDGNFMF